MLKYSDLPCAYVSPHIYLSFDHLANMCIFAPCLFYHLPNGWSMTLDAVSADN